MNRTVVIAVATTALATWGVKEAWDSFGWLTPEQHVEEHGDDIAHIHDMQGDIKALVGYWDCYNLSVDIGRLLEIQDPTAIELEELRQLRRKSDQQGCSPP